MKFFLTMHRFINILSFYVNLSIPAASVDVTSWKNSLAYSCELALRFILLSVYTHSRGNRAHSLLRLIRVDQPNLPICPEMDGVHIWSCMFEFKRSFIDLI